jgi:hypothetical protein
MRDKENMRERRFSESSALCAIKITMVVGGIGVGTQFSVKTDVSPKPNTAAEEDIDSSSTLRCAPKPNREHPKVCTSTHLQRTPVQLEPSSDSPITIAELAEVRRTVW